MQSVTATVRSMGVRRRGFHQFFLQWMQFGRDDGDEFGGEGCEVHQYVRHILFMHVSRCRVGGIGGDDGRRRVEIDGEGGVKEPAQCCWKIVGKRDQ